MMPDADTHQPSNAGTRQLSDADTRQPSDADTSAIRCRHTSAIRRCETEFEELLRVLLHNCFKFGTFRPGVPTDAWLVAGLADAHLQGDGSAAWRPAGVCVCVTTSMCMCDHTCMRDHTCVYV